MVGGSRVLTVINTCMKRKGIDKICLVVQTTYRLLSNLFSSIVSLRLTAIGLFTTLIPVYAFVFIYKMVPYPMDSKKIEIRGIYGSPEPFWKKNLRVDELGVNSVLVHDRSITDSMMTRAKAEGLKVFAEFATLNGKDYVNEHPEAWAVD